MRVWVPTKTGIGRTDGLGAIIDHSLVGGTGYTPRVRLCDGQLHTLAVRSELGAAQKAVTRYAGVHPDELPVSERPRPTPTKEVAVDQITELTKQVQALTEQVAKLTQAGPPDERRVKQARDQAEKREAVWINLGAPNGYIHPSGRAKVEWTGRHWVAYVDGRRLRKVYRKSFNARVAAGLKLADNMRKAA
jgi:hypothetical protein